jgi:hypothetical protein
MKSAPALSWVLTMLVMAGPAWAEQPASPSSYLDEIRQELKAQDAEKKGDAPSEGGSYTESLKKKLQEKDAASGAATGESYSEQLKRELEEDSSGAKTGDSYTDREKLKLEPKTEGGAIQAVREGRSELKGKRVGEIHHAGGIRVGAAVTRDITATSEVGSVVAFGDIYGEKGYAPDVTLFYEYQPWHSEWFGSFGLAASLGFSYFKGTGIFAVANLRNPDGDLFPSKSRVDTQFFAIPVTVGLNYRFNLLRILRPFVMAGPSLIGFYETRSDEQGSHYASSRAYYVSGGVSILLDWLSREASWELYAEHKIQHFYLTVQYDRLTSFSSPVDFVASGVFGGLTFEF